jgi:hypothetical protein
MTLTPIPNLISPSLNHSPVFSYTGTPVPQPTFSKTEKYQAALNALHGVSDEPVTGLGVLVFKKIPDLAKTFYTKVVGFSSYILGKNLPIKNEQNVKTTSEKINGLQIVRRQRNFYTERSYQGEQSFPCFLNGSEPYKQTWTILYFCQNEDCYSFEDSYFNDCANNCFNKTIMIPYYADIWNLPDAKNCVYEDCSAHNDIFNLSQPYHPYQTCLGNNLRYSGPISSNNYMDNAEYNVYVENFQNASFLKGQTNFPLPDMEKVDACNRACKTPNLNPLVESSIEIQSHNVASGANSIPFNNQYCAVDYSVQNWTITLPPLNHSYFNFLFFGSSEENYLDCGINVVNDFFDDIGTSEFCGDPTINETVLSASFGEGGVFSVYAQKGLLPKETNSSFPVDKIQQCQIDILESHLKREEVMRDIFKISCVILALGGISAFAIKYQRSKKRNDSQLTENEDTLLQVSSE